ncbi:MAG TPA: class I SAM-dependent methyltransferase [bacterium]|nr:class I SAM-dependent methyltransferase [bacterium]
MPWTAQAFDEWYLLVYPHRDEAEGRRLIRLLDREVHLQGAKVIDLGCGPGRHLSALEDAGAQPVGLDRSASLLREAARRIQTTESRALLVRADWRNLPFPADSFDGAASLFTSFGYFSEEDDRRTLCECSRVLHQGGFFLLDYLNRNRVLAERCEPRERSQGEYTIHENKALQENGRRIVKRVTISRSQTGAMVADYEERVTLYAAEELRALLSDAGFRVQHIWGDYEGAAYDPALSPRTIFLGLRGPSCA